jgi:hypothetical protein
MYNTRFHIQKPFASKIYICSSWMSEKITMISVYNINLLVIITKSIFTVQYELSLYSSG